MKMLAQVLLVFAFALGFGQFATADDAPAASAAAPMGHHGHPMMSPACKADAEKLCPGMKGPAVHKCMMANKDKVSPECQADWKAHHEGKMPAEGAAPAAGGM